MKDFTLINADTGVMVARCDSFEAAVDALAESMGDYYSELLRDAVSRLSVRECTPNVLNAILFAMEEDAVYVSEAKR